MKIAFVGYEIQEKYNRGVRNNEDVELLAFLRKNGLDITPVIWNDSEIHWADYDLVILKSPWDYHQKIKEFRSWLEWLRKTNIRLLNPAEIVQWNSHKSYLKDIADKGFPVIPSQYLPAGSAMNDSLFSAFNSEQLVIKPCVSAGAKNTIVLTKENIAEKSKEIEKLLKEEDYIAQPFINEIKDGEWSFIFFNGKYSHCILKKAKPGDFRVQHYLGGSISYPKGNPKHIEQAAAYVKTFAQDTLYARVDGVLIHDDFHLMELELIEPYLFLRSDKKLFENYYRALIELI